MPTIDDKKKERCPECGERGLILDFDPTGAHFWFCRQCGFSCSVTEFDPGDDDDLQVADDLIELANMALHEVKEVGVLRIVRVPGGWLYIFSGIATFVPLPDGLELIY